MQVGSASALLITQFLEGKSFTRDLLVCPKDYTLVGVLP